MSKEKKLVPKLRFEEFKNSNIWTKNPLTSLVNGIDTGKSSFNSRLVNSIEKPYPILGSRGIIGYDNTYDYKGSFILTARVGENAGNLYKHSGKVKISDNTVYLEAERLNFVYYLLANYDLKKLSFGTGQPLIKASEIRDLNLNMPIEVKEQNKVGSFFEQIDKMIQLQQSKVNKVKDLKSAYLSEMFPKAGDDYPIRRFEGFHGSWETCHLGQVAGINKGEQLNKEKMIKSGKYYVLNGGINPSGYTNTYNTKEQTISISEGGNSCGYVNYNEEKFWSGGHNYALTNPKINVLYLYYFLKSRQDEIMSLRVGSGLPNIQITALSEFYISYPLRDEQEKIGQFFNNLDKQISIEEEKLAKLEKLKQAYLNDMFV